MIQRPQTLFFLANIAICIMLMFSNIVFFNAENPENEQSVQIAYSKTIMMAVDEVGSETNTYLLAFTAAIAIMSLVALLIFKNRKLQILCTSINYVLILALIAMMYLYSLHMDYFEGAGSQSYTYAAILPMALLFFNFLALRGVKKDEALIRSMDRLR